MNGRIVVLNPRRSAVNHRQQAMNASRESILRAAGHQFATFGYEATSFTRVAAAMQKPRSAIGYHLFPSKLALATEVIERQQIQWRDVDMHVQLPAGPERFVTLLLSATLEAHRCPTARGAVRLLHELPRMGFDVPHVYDWRLTARREMAASLRGATSAHPDVEDQEIRVFFAATLGLLSGTTDMPPAVFEQHLKTLWAPLLESFGIDDARTVIDRVLAADLSRTTGR